MPDFEKVCGCASLQVSFIVAACENMIAGHGLRPGDILTAANGKTVEVTNTGARLMSGSLAVARHPDRRREFSCRRDAVRGR